VYHPLMMKKEIIGDFHKNIKDVIIWDKGFGEPAMGEKIIKRGHEQILLLTDNIIAGRRIENSVFHRGTMQDIWRIPRSYEKVDGHSATFPVALPEKAIQGWTNPGDTVLDPFCGSGTTGVASINLQRKFIGIEISEKYFDISCKRIENAYKKSKLSIGHAIKRNIG
jgi:site-specific DNA-methyltransferase (adenine-specific)